MSREAGKPLPIETLPRTELEKIQNKRLRYTLRMAYEHTKFWHEKFDSLRIKPEDLRNKEDLLKAYENGLELTINDFIGRYASLLPDYLSELFCQTLWSSSLGSPKRIVYTLDDIKRSNEQVCEILNAMGLKKGDRVISMLAPSPFSSGFIGREGSKEYGLHLQEIMVTIPPKQLSEIFRQYRANSLWGLSSRLLQLAREFKQGNIYPTSFEIKSIGIGGESTSSAMKSKLEEEWGSEIFDMWGTTEASTLGFDCNFHSGMHITEPRVIMEVVKRESREVLDENEEGNDLVTVLCDDGERPGMFIINYSLGDVTRKISEEKCECGRTLVRVDYPKRVDETMHLEGRKIWAKAVEKVILPSQFLTGEYALLEYLDKTTKQILGYEVKIQIQKNVNLDPRE